MPNIFVSPAAGRRVRDPATMQVIGDHYEIDPNDPYWYRRLVDADVTDDAGSWVDPAKVDAEAAIAAAAAAAAALQAKAAAGTAAVTQDAAKVLPAAVDAPVQQSADAMLTKAKGEIAQAEADIASAAKGRSGSNS